MGRPLRFRSVRDQYTWKYITENSLLGLIAKPFAPRVPLLVLAFAGAIPDAAFFVLQFFGLETFNLDTGIVRAGGCFPYTNEYPYSHSLAGMTVLGQYLSIQGTLHNSRD